MRSIGLQFLFTMCVVSRLVAVGVSYRIMHSMTREVRMIGLPALLNYQLQGFSVERLMKFLTAVDREVEIVIHHRPRARKGGRILVTAA